MSAESAVLAGRTAAESLMVDACTITRPGVPGVFNETTGVTPLGVPVVVYTGKCGVQLADVQAGTAVVGGTEWTVQPIILKLPVVGSEAVTIGLDVTITACLLDAALVGQESKVVALHSKSFATSRRLRCEVA